MKADEDAFKQLQEADRVKDTRTRKVQEGVDRAREQNARRKMDKAESREWDTDKPTGERKQGDGSKTRGGRGGRGGPRGRGRGRGGRGGGVAPDNEAAPATTWTTTENT